MGKALLKAVFIKSGSSTLTYDIDSTTNRILALQHPQQEWSQTAQILLDNRDQNLTGIVFEGYSGVISYGYNDPTAGDEFSATAPLTVISAKADTIFRPNGDLLVSIGLAGLFNMWGEQEATEAYTPDRINTDTVKTILDAIAGATLTCFNTYPAHTITYDSGYDDSIINAFTPKDSFSISKGESRLSAFKKAMYFLKCKARVRNDAGVATIHIFQPTITGTTYDYEYNDAIAAANHNFFNKSTRTRLVLPNKVVVMNHPSHTDTYTGSAADAASYAALGNQYYTKTVYVRPDSNAQCDLIAAAILQGYQMAAEKGHGVAPMNVGQEVIDYVKITDSAANDTRIGNIGFLQRNYSAGKFEFEFRFGELFASGLAGTLPPRALEAMTPGEITPTDFKQLWENVLALAEAYSTLYDYLNNMNNVIQAVAAYVYAIEDNAEFSRLSVTERFFGPQGTNMYDV